MEINVTDQNGVVHKIDAEPGVSLMLAIREAGLLIKAECGGCCLCATCHVYVAEDWQSHLPSKSADEDMTLSEGCEILDFIATCVPDRGDDSARWTDRDDRTELSLISRTSLSGDIHYDATNRN